MESISHRLIQILLSFGIGLALFGCANTKVLEYENIEKLEKNKEYDELLRVKQLPDTLSGKAALEEKKKKEEAKNAAEASKKAKAESNKKTQAEKKNLVPKPKKKKKKKKVAKVRQPTIEDSDNFEGRRPVKDPFRVGEKARFSMTYFNITAGYMDMMVKPFVEVNGETAYNFEIHVKSSSFFKRIYTVDDRATTFVNYQTLLPYNLDIKVRESKQLKDIKSYLDNNKLKGTHWEKKVTEEKGEQEKKKEWNIKPFSQNVISAIYYLRNFTLTPGKKLQFRVADDGKNIVFSGEVLRREKLKTEIGKIDTVVVRPKITVDGAFKQVGEILVWLTDDDRKFVVRIESKIKIGTIIAKIKSLDKGV